MFLFTLFYINKLFIKVKLSITKIVIRITGPNIIKNIVFLIFLFFSYLLKQIKISLQTCKIQVNGIIKILVTIKTAEKTIAKGIYKIILNHTFTASLPLKTICNKKNIGRITFIGN